MSKCRGTSKCLRAFAKGRTNIYPLGLSPHFTCYHLSNVFGQKEANVNRRTVRETWRLTEDEHQGRISRYQLGSISHECDIISNYLALPAQFKSKIEECCD